MRLFLYYVKDAFKILFGFSCEGCGNNQPHYTMRQYGFRSCCPERKLSRRGMR